MTDGIRINRYLSMSGYCSRRSADRLVQQGKVTIDGVVAQCGSLVYEGQKVYVSQESIEPENETVLYALYKPVGYISSLSDEQGRGISFFLKDMPRMYPVGRLDKDSEGLLLLTNDGELMNDILKAGNGHEKEYIVTVDKNIDDIFIRSMENGVVITDRAKDKKVCTAPCKVEKISEKVFKIVLIQGLNRQIRRMCGSLGYKVISLKRIRIMNITLGKMKPGELKKIDCEKYNKLKEMTIHGQGRKN